MPEVLYTAIIATAKLGMRALGQPIDITGLEHLPRTGPALLAVNHVGYVDFIYGGVAPERIGRRVRFMAKRELFDHRVSGPIMRACRHIAVDRAEGEASLAEAHATPRRRASWSASSPRPRSRGPWRSRTSRPARSGSPHRAGVPLIPMVLWGTQRLMTKDHPRTSRAGPPSRSGSESR